MSIVNLQAIDVHAPLPGSPQGKTAKFSGFFNWVTTFFVEAKQSSSEESARQPSKQLDSEQLRHEFFELEKDVKNISYMGGAIEDKLEQQINKAKSEFDKLSKMEREFRDSTRSEYWWDIGRGTYEYGSDPIDDKSYLIVQDANRDRIERFYRTELNTDMPEPTWAITKVPTGAYSGIKGIVLTSEEENRFRRFFRKHMKKRREQLAAELDKSASAIKASVAKDLSALRKSVSDKLNKTKKAYLAERKEEEVSMTSEISWEESLAVERYTNMGYSGLNFQLRSNPDHPPPEAVILSNALQKVPGAPGYSYRGITLTGEQFEKIKSYFKKGEVVSDEAFLSASRDMGIAKGFASGTHGVIFKIKGYSGREVCNHRRVREKEILFDRKTEFTVTAVTQENSIFVVDLIEGNNSGKPAKTMLP